MRTYSRTNADPEMQEDLAAYGLMRRYAKEKTKGGEFFGLRDTGAGYETQFKDDPRNIDKDMTLAMIAPDHEPFDMLVKKDFKKAVTVHNPKTIREYIRKLIDKLDV